MFNIPPEQWEKMNEDEQRQANQDFLDWAIKNNAVFILSNPPGKAIPGSSYDWELQYMKGQGYVPNNAGNALIRPGPAK